MSDLFTVNCPKARNKGGCDFGDTPFVMSGVVSNGVMKRCNSKPDELLGKGNYITVSPVDSNTSYQPMDFLGCGGTGSSILMLRNDWLSPYLGLFAARTVQQTCPKYIHRYIGNKDSIKRGRIILPVISDDEPDYAFMEQYTKNITLKKRK